MILKTSKILILSFLLLFMFNTLFSDKIDEKFYLGVLAEGYPLQLVQSELRFASARLVDFREGNIIFSINEKTKLTTFMKNVPFVKEVWFDDLDIKMNKELKKNPLFRKFLSLTRGLPESLKSMNKMKVHPGKDITTGKGVKSEKGKPEITKTLKPRGKKKIELKGNMGIIDKKLKKKSKIISSKKLKKENENYVVNEN